MKPLYKIGDKVRVSSDNDNENYNAFRDKVLIITHIATNEEEHRGYDNAIDGALYDFEEFKTGKEIPCSLYEYELEQA